MMDVNARSMLVTTQVAAAAMIAAGRGGRIVNMASMGAKRAGADQAHYAASKAAVVALTQAAAIELGPHGITVNAICPGYVLTEMGAATRTPEMVADVERDVAARPLRRAGRRRRHGPVPGVGRRRLLHRPGVQRHRWDDDALRSRVTTETTTTDHASAAALAFTDVSKTFPDGTFALGSTTFDVAPGEFVTIVGPSGLRQVDAAAHRLRARHARAPGRSASTAAASATSSRTPRCCRGARCAATSSCSPSSTAWTRPSGPAASPRTSPSSASRGSRTSTRSSCRAGCGCGRRSPGRSSWSPRCSCSTSRSARSTRSPASASTTSCSACSPRKGFGALFITHSITEAVFLSTRVLVMSAAAGPDPALVRRPVRVPALARPALRPGVRRAVGRGQPRPPRRPRLAEPVEHGRADGGGTARWVCGAAAGGAGGY